MDRPGDPSIQALGLLLVLIAVLGVGLFLKVQDSPVLLDLQRVLASEILVAFGVWGGFRFLTSDDRYGSRLFRPRIPSQLAPWSVTLPHWMWAVQALTLPFGLFVLFAG